MSIKDKKHIKDQFGGKRSDRRAGPSFDAADRVQFEGVSLNAMLVLPKPENFGPNDAIGLMSEISFAYGQSSDAEIAPTKIDGQYGFCVYNDTTASIERIAANGQNEIIMFISLTEPANTEQLRETLSAVLQGFKDHTKDARSIAHRAGIEAQQSSPSTPAT